MERGKSKGEQVAEERKKRMERGKSKGNRLRKRGKIGWEEDKD